jgi:hypothetical protein
MPHFTQSYRNLLAFIGSMSYMDFSTVYYSVVLGLLQEAGVVSEQEVYMVDVPPYTTPAIDLRFELSQETGHRNSIRLTFTAQEQLAEFHLRTSL